MYKSEESRQRQLAGLKSYTKENPSPYAFTSENNPTKGGEEHPEAKAHAGLRREARKYRDLAIQTLVEVMMQTKHVGARVDAAQEMLTRGYGRPGIMVEGKEKTPATKINVTFGDGSQGMIVDPQYRGIVEHQLQKTINGDATDLVSELADGDD
jgi:hypothetical protein